MIRTPTLFILGAGASCPYGLPSGTKLLLQSLESLKLKANERNVATMLGRTPAAKQRLEAFRSALHESRSYSVDVFLEHRQEYLDDGKFCIAWHLLAAEKMCNARFNRGSIEGDWYRFLLSRMGAQRDDFTKNQVAFVTFNYDRSLEQYMWTALKARYGADDKSAARMAESIEVVHVYGSLGNLPWQDPTVTHAFAASSNEGDVRTAAQSIKIMAEGTDESDEFRRAGELFQWAERVYFVGFGFHDVNLGRLIKACGPDLIRHRSERPRVLKASAYRMRTAECARPVGIGVRCALPDLDALEFLREEAELD